MQEEVWESAHGSPAFPVAMYPICYPDGSDFLYYSHLHNELEYFFLKSGHVKVYVNGIPYDLSPGDALLITPAALHYAKRAKPGDCDTLSLLCHADFLFGRREEDAVNAKCLSALTGAQRPAALYLSGAAVKEDVAGLFSQVRSPAEQGAPGYEMLVKARLLELTYQFLFAPGGYTAHAESSPDLDVIRQSLLYFQTNYQHDVTLGELSAFVHMSPGQFGRLFRRMMAQPPMTYLVQYRVQRATRLLSETNLRVSEIALQTGFRNFSYFNKCFLQYKGVTPTRFRRLRRAQEEIRPPAARPVPARGTPGASSPFRDEIT